MCRNFFPGISGGGPDPPDPPPLGSATAVYSYQRRAFFCCGNSAADISKSHTSKWDPLADEVLEAA